MVTVKLPRASWETLFIVLDTEDHPLIVSLKKEIENQVYSQEY